MKHGSPIAVVIALAAACGQSASNAPDHVPDAHVPAATATSAGSGAAPVAAKPDGTAVKPVAASPSLADARALVTRWIEARRAGDLEAYVALYAAGFQGVQHRAGVDDLRLDRAAWKQDAQTRFAAKSAAVDVYVDQYAVERDGTISAAFKTFRPNSAAVEAALELLTLVLESGHIAIVRQESTPLAATIGRIPVGAGVTGVNNLFAPSFTTDATLDGGKCNDRDECAPALELGGAHAATFPLGIYVNNPSGDGDQGTFESWMLAVPLVAFGQVAGAALVVVENRDPDHAVIGRRGTLLGGGPEHRLLWTGDLLAFTKGQRTSYALGGGEKVDQYLPGSSDEAPLSCRLSVLGDELRYGCGTAETIPVAARH